MQYQFRQRGAATLVTAVILLIAMSIITLAGARIAINKQRISSNSAHAERAFFTAESGIDNGIAYLQYNHSLIGSTATGGWLNAGSSPKWTACSTSDTDLPCGDGSNNLYGSDWMYYGPVPNLATTAGDYIHEVWALSDTLTDAAPITPSLGCLNLGLTSLLPALTNLVVGIVNGLLNTLGGILGQPGMALPTNLCLPLNFEGSNNQSPPSEINPSLRVISSASHPGDVLGGAAVSQQNLSTSSLFLWQPMAPLMVDGTVGLTGDIRIYGNPRPPTVAPYDWSVLQLNDVAGLNVTNLLGLQVQSDVASLAPLLNLTVAQVLALNWNVTFPLSIWSHQNTTMHSAGVGLGLLSGARTCAPQYDGTTNPACTPFSQAIDIPAHSIAPLTPLININLPIELPDVQDEHNLVSTITGLLDSGSPVDFPDDVMAHVFGIPAADYADLQADAQQLSDCSTLDAASTGLYWINGACTLSGAVGSADSPPIVITNGDLTLSDGAHFSGTIFMRGASALNITAPSGPAIRPTILGSVVSEEAVVATGDFNLVHDPDRIRASGYRAGELTRTPGGWTDELAGP